MGRTLEQYWPLLLAVIAGVALWLLCVDVAEHRFDIQLTSVVSVSAILMGFLGTVKAMLLGFRSKQFDWLRSKKQTWHLFLGYLRTALLASLVLCLLSMGILAFGVSAFPSEVRAFVFPTWVGIVVYAVGTFYRVLHLIFCLLARETS